MYALSGTGTVSLTTYSNNSTYNDEWNIAKIGYMSETATLEGQQEPAWCWATAARMFAKQHANFNSNITQLDAVRAVATFMGDGHLTDTQLELYSGDIGMGLMAINYYLGKTPLDSYDIATPYENQTFSETQLLSFLNQGQTIYIDRKYIDAPDYGHAILIYGYVIIDGDYWYLIRDPLPVGIGESYFMSYERLCDDTNDASGISDPLKWRSSIVLTNS